MLDFQRTLFKRSGLYRALGNSYDLSRLFGATVHFSLPERMNYDGCWPIRHIPASSFSKKISGVRFVHGGHPRRSFVVLTFVEVWDLWLFEPAVALVYGPGADTWRVFERYHVDYEGNFSNKYPVRIRISVR